MTSDFNFSKFFKEVTSKTPSGKPLEGRVHKIADDVIQALTEAGLRVVSVHPDNYGLKLESRGFYFFVDEKVLSIEFPTQNPYSNTRTE